MSSDFDRYQRSYANHVDRAIAFARTDAALFAELKAADLVGLSMRFLGLSSKVKALDFGCGMGVLDGLVALHFSEVVGVDVSTGLLEVAAGANPQLEYRHYDGTTIPYEDGTFDLGFAVCVFHHIDPQRRRAAAVEGRASCSPGWTGRCLRAQPA